MSDQTFLSGAGEMGALFRSVDWVTTGFGSVGAWPQSLRTTMSICLNSKFPIAVYWGPEYLMLYNLSLVPMVGPTKHPQALGQPASVVLAEIWQIIEPLLRKVRTTGEATWSEDLMLPLARTGRPEESYFTFTYSPIRDETGGVGGVFCAVVETTEQVIEGRRLRLLNALAEGARAQSAAKACAHAAAELARAPKDVPFAALYLLDAEGTAVLAGTANVEAGGPIAPATIRPGDGSDWRLDGAEAVLLPIENAGGGTPFGFMVLGLSPLLTRGDSYQRFHTLLAASISQLVSNGAAIDEARKRAEALASIDRAKTAFFSNISHEFRTPLTLMLGPLEDSLADTDSPLSPRQRARQELIHRNGQRLLKLVNSLLDFSRIEAGRVRASFRPTDLATLTSEVASHFDSVIAKAGLALKIESGALPEAVYVDAELWEKVVLNLISNAFKFTFEGGIRVVVRAEDGHAVLEVTDTGIGISPGELPHLFERFHRVEGAKGRSYEGSGIGLALVQELVKLHGGTLAVRSEPGRGSTFSVKIPFGSAHLPREQVGHEAPDSKKRPGAGLMVEEAAGWEGGGTQGASTERLELRPAAAVPAHVLLADDNADMRRYITRLLEARGWSVDAVSNGEEALERARARRPDLLLTDVMMPGLDGFGLMRAMRADPLRVDVPCVLVSARAGEEAKVEAIEAGADDYLVKPFSARELVSRVASRLELSRAHAAARLADQRKDEFLAMLSHELRNPIAAISAALELLGTDTDEALREKHREAARRQMSNLVRMVDDLLDVSRITRGVIELQKTQVELGDVVRGAVAATRATIDARRHRLTVDVGPGPFVLSADATRLEQVLTNLINNAAKYTEPGGQLSLTLSREVAGDEAHAIICMRDNGRGIPAEMLDEVFELFVQVEQSIDRRLGGLGLGLTLVKRLVALHGGQVEVRSEGAGKGSEFRVRLPLGRPSSVAPAVERTPGELQVGPRRVVLVEDSDDLREGLKDLLEGLGHRVETAADGLMAVAKILELRPDVALIDVGIPGIDGYEVARRVRAALPDSQMRLVALTGYGSSEAKGKAREAGFDLHAAKPIDVTRLGGLLGG